LDREADEKKDDNGVLSDAEKMTRRREKERKKFNKELADGLCKFIKYN